MRYFLLACLLLLPQTAWSADPTVNLLPANLRLDTDYPGGYTSENCSVGADGDFVVVAWSDKRNGNEDIYCNFSTNGGRTWKANDIRLNTNAAGASRSLRPSVAVSGAHAYVAWQDTRNGYADIYLNSTANSGQSWLAADKRLNLGSSAGSTLCWAPNTLASGNNAYVGWIETRFGYLEGLFFNHSTNGGTSWQATDVQVDDGASDVLEEHFIADGATIYAIWNQLPGNVYFNRSDNSGAAWFDNAARVNAGGEDQCENLDFTVDQSTVYAFWDRNPGTGRKINYNWSTNKGTSWQATDTELDFNSNPRVVFKNQTLHLTYNSEKYIYYRRYRSEGGWSDPINIRVGAPPTSSQGVPFLFADGEMVFAVWYDDGCLDRGVRYNYSLDNGATFHEGEWLYMNDNSCEDVAVCLDPSAAFSGDKVFAAWEDNRTGPYTDIYFDRALIGGGACPVSALMGLLFN